MTSRRPRNAPLWLLAWLGLAAASCDRPAPEPYLPPAATEDQPPDPDAHVSHDATAPAVCPPCPAPRVAEPVRLGVDRVLDEELALLRGKRVGLITNASGVDGELVPTADRFAAHPDVKLVRLYAPEHGLRGALAAGAKIDDARDPNTGIPIQSLFGKRRAPSRESLAEIDVLVFDIQDVGSRTYTYVSTLGRSMEAAANAGVPVVVLDRPNPQGGLLMEGPIRAEKYKSFIGWAPLPVSHGMTIGELARFYVGELDIAADLTVVEMRGWTREMTWSDTALHWVPTSPNIPHARNAHLYIATGMVAGASKNVNESAGYTMPFETLAAAFIDEEGAAAFAADMNGAGLGGVRFRPIAYEPRSGRFEGDVVRGVQLVLTDPGALRPLRVALTALVTLEARWPGMYAPRGKKAFGRIWGTDAVLPLVRAGSSVAEIEASWAADLTAFADRRAPYLLY